MKLWLVLALLCQLPVRPPLPEVTGLPRDAALRRCGEPAREESCYVREASQVGRVLGVDRDGSGQLVLYIGQPLPALPSPRPVPTATATAPVASRSGFPTAWLGGVALAGLGLVAVRARLRRGRACVFYR